MDGRTHSKYFFLSLIVFIPLFIWKQMYLQIPLLILASSIVDPDEDQKWKNGKAHRSAFTHSVLWAFIIIGAIGLSVMDSLDLTYAGMLVWVQDALVTCSIPILIHLALDLPVSRHKIHTDGDELKYGNKPLVKKGTRTGKYRVSFYPMDFRLSGVGTVIWIVVNILLIIGYIGYMFGHVL